MIFDRVEAAREGELTIEMIHNIGRRGVFVPLDVTDVEAIPRALATGIDQLGLPIVWVNNAGTVARGPALAVAPEEWYRVLNTCLTGAFFCAQAFAARLVEEELNGVIVNIASVFGLVAGPHRAAYSAAKAGLVNLTRVLASEWYPYGIRVNCVAPTFVKTTMTMQLLSEGLDIVNKSFGEQVASVEDVARAVRFLASADARMINGHTLAVDGGWVSW